MRFPVLAALSFSLLLGAACDGTLVAPEAAPGRFVLRGSGLDSFSAEGRTAYAMEQDSVLGRYVSTLMVSEDTTRLLVVNLILPRASLPSEGIHSIQDAFTQDVLLPDQFAAVAIFKDHLLLSKSGRVVIKEATAERLVGTFQLELAVVDFEGTSSLRPLTLEGSFDAPFVIDLRSQLSAPRLSFRRVE